MQESQQQLQKVNMENQTKMNVFHFNLNTQVKVKVTQAGQKYLKQKKLQLEADEEGFTTLALWEFSGIFSDALQLPTLNPPIEPNIIVLANKANEPVEIGSIAICAIRYAMPIAQKQIKDDCIAGVKYYWNIIPVKDKNIIARDLKEATENEYSAKFASAWHEFFEWVCDSQGLTAVEEHTHLGKLTVFAVRYCVGRMSYMPSLIVDATKDNWHLLSKDDRAVIKDEVRLAIKTRDLGMDCDRLTWTGFDSWIAANS